MRSLLPAPHLGLSRKQSSGGCAHHHVAAAALGLRIWRGRCDPRVRWLLRGSPCFCGCVLRWCALGCCFAPLRLCLGTASCAWGIRRVPAKRLLGLAVCRVSGALNKSYCVLLRLHAFMDIVACCSRQLLLHGTCGLAETCFSLATVPVLESQDTASGSKAQVRSLFNSGLHPEHAGC